MQYCIINFKKRKKVEYTVNIAYRLKQHDLNSQEQLVKTVNDKRDKQN